jgi:hypothetical protein
LQLKLFVVLCGVQVLDELRLSRVLEREFRGVLVGCDTRFFYGLRQAERLLLIDPALRKLEERWAANNVEWLPVYRRLLAAWSAVRPAAQAILALFLPLLNDYERLGSEHEYTLSVR